MKYIWVYMCIQQWYKMHGHWKYIIPNIIYRSKRHFQTKMHDIPQRYEARGLWKDLIPNICIKEQKIRPSDIWQWYEAYGLWKYLIPNTCK